MLDHLSGWQFGEQELIPAILKAIDADGDCVEYGAGDGESLPLTIEQMYKSGNICWLIEIDDNRRSQLKAKYPLAVVEKDLNWKAFTETCRSDEGVSLVVIDIDGRDSIVMREMLDSGCRPALLVVEHFDRYYSIGTTLPSPIPEWLLGQQLISHHDIQDTAETLQWIAAKYGYERIGLNRCNSFFVRRDLFPLLFR